jgi:Tfp pilus assembly protein PilF
MLVAPDNDKPVPFWKGIISWQVPAAILAVAAFVFTIVNPDKVPAAGPGQADRAVRDLSLLSEGVLEDVNKTKAMTLLASGKNGAAIDQADKEVKAHPYTVRTLMVAGDVYCDAPDADKTKGLAYLRKSVALCPQSRYVRINFARHLAKAKKFEEAIAQYELLDKSASEEWTPARIELADLYLVKNETAKAVDLLKKVMQNDTKNGAAQERLGLSMARNNDDKEGFEEFSKGFAIRQMQNHLPELSSYLTRYDNSKSKAESALQKEVKDNPESQDNIILLGELYLSENKTQAAKDLLSTY